jgi:hypothetical protein
MLLSKLESWESKLVIQVSMAKVHGANLKI